MSKPQIPAADLVSVGSIVEYRDVANPPARYVVIVEDRHDKWSPFVLRSLDAETGYAYSTSDLRQSGWSLISA